MGWSAEEVRTYEELWEYRQRWGAINLEREERQLLRKAEAALPKRLSGKAAQRKSIRDKNHYIWLSRHLEACQAIDRTLEPGEIGAWTILLEEELRALRYYQPVLGLPDTLKAKAFEPERERWAASGAASGRVAAQEFGTTASDGEPIRPLRGETLAGNSDYPVLQGTAAEAFRGTVRQEICAFTRATYPSLKDSDKPEPPDTWEGV